MLCKECGISTSSPTPLRNERKKVPDRRTEKLPLNFDLSPYAVLRKTDLGVRQDGRDRDPEGVVCHDAICMPGHTAPETERDVFGVEDVWVEHAVPEELVGVESVWVEEHLVVVADRPVKVSFRSDTMVRNSMTGDVDRLTICSR